MYDGMTHHRGRSTGVRGLRRQCLVDLCRQQGVFIVHQRGVLFSSKIRNSDAASTHTVAPHLRPQNQKLLMNIEESIAGIARELRGTFRKDTPPLEICGYTCMHALRYAPFVGIYCLDSLGGKDCMLIVLSSAGKLVILDKNCRVRMAVHFYSTCGFSSCMYSHTVRIFFCNRTHASKRMETIIGRSPYRHNARWSSQTWTAAFSELSRYCLQNLMN